jgi:sn-glycerol 3-phosphate transport system permease protein
MRDVPLATKSYTIQAPLLGYRFWQHVQRALGYAAMLAVVLIIGIPVAWVLSGALKTNREIFTTNPQLLPANPNFDNFVKAWQAAPFDRFYINSFITTVLGAGAEIIMAITTAYALAFVRFPKRDWIFFLLLVALMVPDEVVLVPNYLTIAGWKMVNTYPGSSFRAPRLPSAPFYCASISAPSRQT